MQAHFPPFEDTSELSHGACARAEHVAAIRFCEEYERRAKRVIECVKDPDKLPRARQFLAALEQHAWGR